MLSYEKYTQPTIVQRYKMQAHLKVKMSKKFIAIDQESIINVGGNRWGNIPQLTKELLLKKTIGENHMP